MKVHRVGVVGTVVKRQPVTRALFEYKLLIVRIGFAVYCEAIELTGTARYLFKNHLDFFRGCRLRWRLAEPSIVPERRGRWRPLGGAALIGVFDDNTQTSL